MAVQCKNEPVNDKSKDITTSPIVTEFHPTLFRTGNSRDGYKKAAKRGVRFVESDFRMTADGALVSAHDKNAGGTCGRVQNRTLEQLAGCKISGGAKLGTLSDFLKRTFEGWFIDLKATETKEENVILRAVNAAIEEIKHTGRQKQAVIMMYNTPPKVVSAIEAAGVRAGMKGYPKSSKDVRELVDKAARNNFEMVCVNIKHVNKQVIEESAKKGIWILAWDLGQNLNLWQELAGFGLGGVITRNVELASEVTVP